MRDAIFQWNLRFKYDRRWRKKYNVSFGSQAHLDSNQIDIYFDLLEDRLFQQLAEDYFESKKHEEDLKKTGKLLKEQVLTSKQEDELLKNIKF